MAEESKLSWLDIFDEDISVDEGGASSATVHVGSTSESKPTVLVSAPPKPAPVAADPIPTPAPAASKPSASPAEERAQDDAEIAKVKEKLAENRIGSNGTAASPLDTAVETAISDPGLGVEQELTERFRMLVSLYFRDLRDVLETTSKLTMPKASGGMGMSDEDAVRVMGVLKKQNAKFRETAKSKASQDKADFVAKRTEAVLGERVKKAEKERTALDSLHSDITGSAPEKRVADEPKIVPVKKEDKGLRVKGEGARDLNVGDKEKAIGAGRSNVVGSKVLQQSISKPDVPAVPKTVQKDLPSSAAPAPKSVQKLVIPDSAKDKAALQAPAPKPAVPKPVPPPTPEPVPIAPQVQVPKASRASMSDVQAAPQLVGPVGELKGIKLVDFRRLSSDPHEATAKIRSKIDLLAEQSFDKRTLGVQAWHDSPTNTEYLGILKKSLEGVPVSGVISQMEGAGQKTLTKAEFDAIMEFNRSLRFG